MPINNQSSHEGSEALLAQLRTVGEEVTLLIGLLERNPRLPALLQARLLIDGDKIGNKLVRHRKALDDARNSGTRAT